MFIVIASNGKGMVTLRNDFVREEDAQDYINELKAEFPLASFHILKKK